MSMFNKDRLDKAKELVLVTRYLINDAYLGIRVWWDDDLSERKRAGIVIVSIIVGMIIFFGAFLSFMNHKTDQIWYGKDKDIYEEHCDKFPDMPRFRENYRIVEFTNGDLWVELKIENKWTRLDTSKSSRIKSVRGSMWGLIAHNVEEWMEANFPRTMKVIE